MCTVTLVPGPWRGVQQGSARLVHNRDELRTRSPGMPPRRFSAGMRRALAPIDSQAHGTWVAISDAGIVYALLNRNVSSCHRRNLRETKISRGMIIPTLLDASSFEEAWRGTLRLDCSNYDPFRLIVTDSIEIAEIWTNGRECCEAKRSKLTRPMLFTSSSLGDEVVLEPRARLFESSVCRFANHVLEQDRFHRHQWSDRREISVLMSRSDAQTVSITTVALEIERATMTYESLSTRLEPEYQSVSLDLPLLRQACPLLMEGLPS